MRPPGAWRTYRQTPNPCIQARASANIYIKVTFFICLQVLDYWTVEVSSSYVSAGMGNLPEGKR